jgi:hypothetical protein
MKGPPVDPQLDAGSQWILLNCPTQCCRNGWWRCKPCCVGKTRDLLARIGRRALENSDESAFHPLQGQICHPRGALRFLQPLLRPNCALGAILLRKASCCPQALFYTAKVQSPTGGVLTKLLACGHLMTSTCTKLSQANNTYCATYIKELRQNVSKEKVERKEQGANGRTPSRLSNGAPVDRRHSFPIEGLPSLHSSKFLRIASCHRDSKLPASRTALDDSLVCRPATTEGAGLSDPAGIVENCTMMACCA